MVEHLGGAPARARFPRLRPGADPRLDARGAASGLPRGPADPELEPAVVVYRGAGTLFELDADSGGSRFYRLRARAGDEPGVWSNTVRVDADSTLEWTLEPPADDAADLLAVQRALLRFCAARRDLLAVLSLPRHLREDGAREHLRRLRPLTDEGASAGTAAEVPPLRFAEAGVLGFGAIYHPWTALLPGDGGGAVELIPTPPEGAVCGAIAARALAGGAWIAPANDPLSGVLALEPALALDARAALAELQINPLVEDPRGFLAWNADTLGGESETRPINVRRLLILLRRLALREAGTWVFEPNDRDFHGRVRHRFERLLSELFVRGAFAGREPGEGYRVVVDESVNPPEQLERGRFIVELRVAPSHPLAFLTVRLVQEGAEQLLLEEV